MSQVVSKNKIWLIPLCVIIVGAASLYGWQAIHAQPIPGTSAAEGPGALPPQPVMPATPGAPGAPVAAPVAPTEPTMSLSALVQGGIRVTKTKNWDGTATGFLNFKYKTLDNRLLKVVLPATYKGDKLTRAGWDTLFQVYDMGYEYQLEAIENARIPDLSAFRDQLMQEIRGVVPEGTYSNPNPAQGALDAAKTMLPSLWGGTVELPPLLPGMM